MMCGDGKEAYRPMRRAMLKSTIRKMFNNIPHGIEKKKPVTQTLGENGYLEENTE